MSALSRTLIVIGLLSLFHAAYSAQEFSAVAARLHIRNDLPLDIKLETILAVSMACFGLVLGTERLRPISWSAWAGEIEKEGGAGNPFRAFEDRVGYLDIRAKRREFAEWAKGQDETTKS